MYFIRSLQYRLLLLSLLAGVGVQSIGQEPVDYEDLLQRVDTVENPVYKPVLSIGYGVMNFLGDVKSSSIIPVIGNPALKVNLTTFIDDKHNFAANFYFLTGTLSGEQRSTSDPGQNFNFLSSIYSIGASARYEFGDLISKEMKLRPYISIGIEQFNFNSKGDLYDGADNLYHYWTDGTIRDRPDNEPGAALPLYRDYIYETDLRSHERRNYGLGDYNLRSFGIPFEIGFSLKVSTRVFISLGTEYHYTFTDFIDNVSSTGTSVVGKGGNDGFLFSHATLHFDMFSEPKTKTVELLYADLDYDPLFFDDEDGDFVLDIADRCPGTPYGVVVDSLGCPVDSDNDGVPDYLDKEPDTPPGVWVDENGVTLSEDEFIVQLQRESALKRDDLDGYLKMLELKYGDGSVTEIPEKFLQIDADGDGYISFDELLRVIDDYFDFEIELSIDELRQVNEFFFSQ